MTTPAAAEATTGAAIGRQAFTSRLAVVATMVGVSVGLGNFWRFPYMTGRYGGAAFVAVYLAAVALIGVPALMAEWALGRHTRRGTAGAFQRAGFPLGRQVGWFFFVVVLAATAYYAVAVGWVLHYAAAGLAGPLLGGWDAAAILPPADGFDAGSFTRQLAATAAVLGTAALVLVRGLRHGIERASTLLIPALFAILLVLIVRSLSLPGAWQGVEWYILKFRPDDLTGGVAVAALGQAIFSLALGGTFMVVYGSYLAAGADLRGTALSTAAADTAAGLLAGLAIFPAVFALGLEPAGGPGLIFDTLPRVFDRIPAGGVFAFLLFFALLCGAMLSAIAALEVLVAGLTDNTRLRRTPAVWITTGAVMLLALPPMINMQVFVPWDLTFGSGMQTLGALLAVLAFGWSLDRAAALRELGDDGSAARVAWLYLWLRFVVPAMILAVGVWWLLTEVFGAAGG